MSKTANDQSNHDNVCHSHNALNNGDLQKACDGSPLPISKSRANRIQALTNNYTAVPTTTTTAAMPAPAAAIPGAPPPPAPINGEMKKKRARQKKKRAKLEENDSSPGQHADDTQEDDAAEAASAEAAVRPGKKRLRRMRYLQSQGSPIDHLLHCAQSCCFTQSVTTLQVPASKAAAPAETTTTDIRVQPLIVLDLNGILCHRIRKNDIVTASTTRKKKTASCCFHHHHDYRPVAFDIANTPVIPRTDITRFVRYMDQHFCLAVWTSAKSKTAKALVKQLFPPDIASRLLFIWDQKDCDVATGTSTTCCNTTNTKEDNQKANKEKGRQQHHHHRHHHATDMVFVKDLAKVWKLYPLWNANNTILMDDSPDKCTQWHENAVHPPPLHGLLLNDKTAMIFANSTDDHLMSDEENERLQQLFFEGLVHYWQNHSMTITLFDEEQRGVVKATTNVVKKQGVSLLADAEPGGELPLNDNDEDYSFKTNNGLVEFLKIHAVGHMGWE